jgi:GNAT superfamily N-acetyltransferase
MRIHLRQPTEADAVECGRICYESFSSVAISHGFPVDWRSEDMAVKVIEARLAHRQTYGIVAEVDGRVVGSAFMKEYHPVGAIGPVTVEPRLQGGGVGRLMMEHLILRARATGLEGTRLVQAAFNTHSLSLYTKLGYEMRELLACMYGNPIAKVPRGWKVRIGNESDMAECNRLCVRLQGCARPEDVAEALQLGSLTVAERDGRIRGYSTGAHFRGHTVAETNDDAKALIAAAEDLPDPGLLMPARNGELLRWALENGLRITQPLTLMTMGLYREPGGAFLPSIHG